MVVGKICLVGSSQNSPSKGGTSGSSPGLENAVQAASLFITPLMAGCGRTGHLWLPTADGSFIHQAAGCIWLKAHAVGSGIFGGMMGKVWCPVSYLLPGLESCLSQTATPPGHPHVATMWRNMELGGSIWARKWTKDYGSSFMNNYGN